MFVPREIANTEEAARLYELGCVTEMDIVQLLYRPSEPEGYAKDYEFSRPSMERRWRQGYPMPKAPCVLRRGWLRCQRSWVCACSIWMRTFRPKTSLTVLISRTKRMRRRPNARQRHPQRWLRRKEDRL